MLTPERHQLILQLVRDKNIVKIQELVEVTHTSESTIRRDLTLLEEEGFLKRVHGGASKLQGKLSEPSMSEKTSKNRHEKQEIASFAAQLVEEGDSIYLDAGSSVTEMIPHLMHKNIVVVTNGLMHLDLLINLGISTYLIGGYIKEKTNALVGRGALLSLNNYRFDKCFMGVNGIHSHSGYTTPDQEEAMVKYAAMKLSREAYVLADNSKFSEVYFSKIADLHEATIITNYLSKEVSKMYASKTRIKVVKV